ncbi:MAG: hypothetical protein KGI79_02410 [Patescibacteria group bacterium]|nr:hypothetical protein [Patescibacteria group bacterium]MDE2116705.1 hypothetical protein [Patescibacteria group bacterium]
MHKIFLRISGAVQLVLFVAVAFIVAFLVNSSGKSIWITIGIILALVAERVIGSYMARQSEVKSEEEEEEEVTPDPVFAEKTVKIYLNDGKVVQGKISCEPEEFSDWIILSDAQFTDDSAAIPSGEISDKLAIPLGYVEVISLMDLDRV